MFQMGWLAGRMAGTCAGRESRMARGDGARKGGRECFGALQHDGGPFGSRLRE